MGATTLVTNALIERRGAKTALVTTRGFGDVLEIGREWRYDLYDPRLQLPDPLVAPTERFEVTERRGPRGEVLTPLDRADVERIADELAAAGVESIAVCLLHSYVDAAHEETIAEILAERAWADAAATTTPSAAPQTTRAARSTPSWSSGAITSSAAPAASSTTPTTTIATRLRRRAARAATVMPPIDASPWPEKSSAVAQGVPVAETMCV
ncbi:hydantoinase/oxoprolinase N-terminal domain-containing protein [Ralstonia pickettii]|uniref:hydantoinase/oxoprolinase N-terminal domain-containing protein n=1 Tax=Ralstonia pickettii TaxID=329 RepID=UPI0021563FF3